MCKNLISQEPIWSNDVVEDVLSHVGVHGTEWVVHQIHIRVLVHSSGQTHTLLLTATQVYTLSSRNLGCVFTQRMVQCLMVLWTKSGTSLEDFYGKQHSLAGSRIPIKYISILVLDKSKSVLLHHKRLRKFLIISVLFVIGIGESK